MVLTIGGIFALVEGLTAVYKSSFFTANAVFVFGDLRTWGWIITGLGVAGWLSGLSVLSGREWARWLGVAVAGLSAHSQLLFAQAYPVWSLMIMAIDVLVIYSLIASAGRQSAAGAASSYDSHEASGSGSVTDLNDRERKSRAAWHARIPSLRKRATGAAKAAPVARPRAGVLRRRRRPEHRERPGERVLARKWGPRTT